MKFYSEKTNVLYDNLEQLEAAEKKFDTESHENELLKNKIKKMIGTITTKTEELYALLEEAETKLSKKDMGEIVTEAYDKVIHAVGNFW